MKGDAPIVFVSNMTGSPWGGSEELWARAACHLARNGQFIRASVLGWSPAHRRVRELAESGVDIRFRPPRYPVWRRALNRAVSPARAMSETEISNLLSSTPPRLVVLCDPASTPPIGIMQECVAKNYPFATISQSNSEYFWPADAEAREYRQLMPLARRCFFVSQTNLRLFENQIGCDLKNAEVVRNPFNVGFEAVQPWPKSHERGELRLACVGRLHPPSKGQDILLEALSDPVWKQRDWRLELYGDGPMRETIELMINRLHLNDRVKVVGFEPSVEKIWSENHVLVMPSRYEGLPLAIVEAMLCGRPVVATNVAGNAEILEDGRTGFLADAATAASIGKALERLWAKKAELREMGLAATASIRRHVPEDPGEAFADGIKAIACSQR
jgi:glycosyltransferase involved in cell wall biosynthesis